MGEIKIKEGSLLIQVEDDEGDVVFASHVHGVAFETLRVSFHRKTRSGGHTKESKESAKKRVR
jgi:hypothetical protein